MLMIDVTQAAHGTGCDTLLAMQSFFSMWWAEQAEHTQKLVQQLVKNKQLGFVNGGQAAPALPCKALMMTKCTLRAQPCPMGAHRPLIPQSQTHEASMRKHNTCNGWRHS